MSLYGLIGYPLSHSFSKKYFTDKFNREGLADQYELFPLKDIHEFRELLKKPGLSGLNVTIPYKQSVTGYLDDISNIPEGLKACNCIKIIDGKTYGYNTDIAGFERSISPYLKSHHKKALILGNGGAAEAVKFVFEKLGIAFAIVSRKIHDGSSLIYADLTKDVISAHPVIVNTTPLGMYPSIENFPAIPYEAISKEHLLFDLIYNPGKTLFLQKGEEQGATILNGHEMLVLQAEESWLIWNSL